jgi:hypothetical protein
MPAGQEAWASAQEWFIKKPSPVKSFVIDRFFHLCNGLTILKVLTRYV